MNWQSELDQAPRSRDWTIAEVREQTGLSARTLRYYEELGLLPGMRRRAGGRRIYGPDDVERLRFIQRLKAMGLSLAEVKELNAVYAIHGSTRAMLGRLDQLLDGHLEEIDSRLAELMSLRDDITGYRDHVAARRAGMNGRGARAARGPDAEGRKS